MENHNKLEYSAPTLVEYGRVEDITRGPSFGGNYVWDKKDKDGDPHSSA